MTIALSSPALPFAMLVDSKTCIILRSEQGETNNICIHEALKTDSESYNPERNSYTRSFYDSEIFRGNTGVNDHTWLTLV